MATSEIPFAPSKMDVSRAIDGVSYPATLGDLVDQAEQNDADDEIVEFISSLLDKTYKNPREVMMAYERRS